MCSRKSDGSWQFCSTESFINYLSELEDEERRRYIPEDLVSPQSDED